MSTPGNPVSKGKRRKPSAVADRNNSTVRSPKSCIYFKHGLCKSGDKCRYAHVPKQAPMTNTINSPVSPATSAPQLVAETSITSSSGNTHVSKQPPDLQLCQFWKAGNCRKGDDCLDIHDDEASETDLGMIKSWGLLSRTDQAKSDDLELMRARVAKREAEEAERVRQEAERARQEAERQRQEEEARLAENARLEAERQRQDEEHRLAEVERLRQEAEKLQRQKEEAERQQRRREEAERQRQLNEARKAEAARRKAEEAARRKAEEAARRRKLEEERAEALRQQQEARRAEVNQREAAFTLRHVVLGTTIVNFAAGVTIDSIVTGFESCRVQVKNLPLDARLYDVRNLFISQGVNEGQFHLLNLKRVGGKQEANVIVDTEVGKPIAIGLDGTDFRGQKLGFEVTGSGSVLGMGAAARPSNVLTISWLAPRVRYVATYLHEHQATAKRRELDGKICSGRRVNVENNRPGPGRPLQQEALAIGGLPPDIWDADVMTFSGALSVHRLKPAVYDEDEAKQTLRHLINLHAAGDMDSFDTVPLNTTEGKHMVRVGFRTWNGMKKVHDALANVRFSWIGSATFRLTMPEPLRYNISISTQQYNAQKKQWDTLVENQKGKKECNLRINHNTQRDCYFVHVGGEDSKAVGMLKVRVETLAAGEKLNVMHDRFDSPRWRAVFQTILADTGALLRYDWRLCAVKAYGGPDAVAKAREMVQEEIEKLASEEWTIVLKRQSIRYFVHHGVAALKETYGDDNVKLDISSSPCKITIRGAADAHHALRRLVDESLDNLTATTTRTSESNCPVCFDEVSTPVTLGCGHIYCTSCIRHFFTTAADTKIFPLACKGDEDNCLTPIPLPTLQKHLPPAQFNRLLEAAFVHHVETRPLEYRYCTTPDCEQIYRSSTSSESTVLQCPSCLSTICSSCHGESHEGMTCEERRVYNDPAEQERLNDEWARQQGVKRCPSCSVWIEKTEGCNHMSCRCGAHICWVCMGVFTHETIYPHMQTAHGGYFAEVDQAPEAVDAGYHVQERILAAHYAEAEARRARELAAADRLRLEAERLAQERRLAALRAQAEAQRIRETNDAERDRRMARTRETVLRMQQEEADDRRRSDVRRRLQELQAEQQEEQRRRQQEEADRRRIDAWRRLREQQAEQEAEQRRDGRWCTIM